MGTTLLETARGTRLGYTVVARTEYVALNLLIQSKIYDTHNVCIYWG